MKLFQGLRNFIVKTLSPVNNMGLWKSIIREPFAGAWQKNLELRRDEIVSHYAVFSCISLIASDISKLPVKSQILGKEGIWEDNPDGKYAKIIKRPNNYQNRIQFFENWIISKLIRGNTFVLKNRDKRQVTGMYILNPDLVTVLVSDSGEVFYKLSADNLSGIDAQVIVPASEIIHDRFNCLFHPLVGLPPLFACGLSAGLGLTIQKAAAQFFSNDSRPSGILSAPDAIDDVKAAEIKQRWNDSFSGVNRGKIAVLGNSLKFEPMNVTAADSQLAEQLKLSAEMICSAFHVPPYKIGVGAQPSYNNIQALNQEYYSQCLQILLEQAELCLDEGLELQANIGLEFDIENLLRMDSMTQASVMKEQAGSGFLAPNEGRRKLNLPPVPGGAFPLVQQQNYSLPALAKRDASDDPFGRNAAKPPVAQQADAAGNPDNAGNQPEQKTISELLEKELENVQYA